MIFGAPPWLLLLIPWSALVLYLLRGARKKTAVPFIQLWQDRQPRPIRRVWQLPPWPVAFALAAILSAILAAARPSPASWAKWKIIELVDRGFTMSSRNESISIDPTEIRYVPPQFKAAIDTRPLLAEAIDSALRDPDAIVVLLSDQKVPRSNVRLVQVVPNPIENIGIADLQIRLAPHPQAMVRILNDSTLTRATLNLTTTRPVAIDLPPRGSEKNYFIDLTSTPPVIRARIDPGLAIEADDEFSAVLSSQPPKIELRTPVDAALQRMVQVYQRHHSPTDDSPILPIVPSPTDGPCVVIPPLTGTRSLTSITTEDHPITAGIDWRHLPPDTTVAPAPSSDWHILVRSADQPLLALRDSPARQVWIGFHSTTWESTPDFVILWANIFDWLSQGQDTYQWTPVSYPDHPWPALALNAPALHLDPPPQSDWHAALSTALATLPPGRADLSPWFLWLAVSLLVIGIIGLLLR